MKASIAMEEGRMAGIAGEIFGLYEKEEIYGADSLCYELSHY